MDEKKPLLEVVPSSTTFPFEIDQNLFTFEKKSFEGGEPCLNKQFIFSVKLSKALQKIKFKKENIDLLPSYIRKTFFLLFLNLLFVYYSYYANCKLEFAESESSNSAEIGEVTNEKFPVLESLCAFAINLLKNIARIFNLKQTDDYVEAFLQDCISQNDVNFDRRLSEIINCKNLLLVSITEHLQPLIKESLSNLTYEDLAGSENTAEYPSLITLFMRDILIYLLLNNIFDARVQEIFSQLCLAFQCDYLAIRLSIEQIFEKEISIMIHPCRKETFKERMKRRLKIASVATSLGIVTAVTAGLAVPTIAAGLGILGVAGTSNAIAFLGTTGGFAAVASVFGASTAGLTGWKYSRRVEKLKVFYFELLKSNVDVLEEISKTEKKNPVKSSNNWCLNITICVSGWLQTLSDLSEPWSIFEYSNSTLYTLHWDPSILLDLGSLLSSFISQRVAISAAQLWLQTTVAGALTTALMWPVALLQFASTLDNAWMVCRDRAAQAGRLLAEVITDQNVIGLRPVSLVGYSIGSKVIFSCLLELHRKKKFDRISDVILLGAPVTYNKNEWQKAREVVSGRFVNAYSTSDWILGFFFRYMEWKIWVAGLSPIKVKGIENVDVTKFVQSHNQYPSKCSDILKSINYYTPCLNTNVSYL